MSKPYTVSFSVGGLLGGDVVSQQEIEYDCAGAYSLGWEVNDPLKPKPVLWGGVKVVPVGERKIINRTISVIEEQDNDAQT